MTPSSESYTPKKRFTPNVPDRPPKLALKRKLSEFASEPTDIEKVNYIEHALSGTLLQSRQTGSRGEALERAGFKKRSKTTVVFGGGFKDVRQREEEVVQPEEDWKASEETQVNPPTQVPFAAPSQASSASQVLVDELGQLRENALVFVQLPKSLALKDGVIRVYESGRVVLVVDGQEFAVLQGVATAFHQELVGIHEERYSPLGPVHSALVVAPEAN
jgi:hypothetical protein